MMDEIHSSGLPQFGHAFIKFSEPQDAIRRMEKSFQLENLEYQQEALSCINRISYIRKQHVVRPKYRKTGTRIDQRRFIRKNPKFFHHSTPAKDAKQVNIDLVIDTSGSMFGYPVLAAKAVTMLWKTVADRFADEINLRIYTVINDGEAEITPILSVSQLADVHADGCAEGYAAYQKVLDNEDHPDFSFFLTDGQFVEEEDIAFLEKMQKEGHQVCGIYVSNDPDHGNLEKFEQSIIMTDLHGINRVLMDIYATMKKQNRRSSYRAARKQKSSI